MSNMGRQTIVDATPLLLLSSVLSAGCFIVASCAPGVTIGSVPLVVSGVPGPADPGDAPWWVRAVGAVVGAAGAVIGSLFG